MLLLILDNTASVGKKSYLIVTCSRPQPREMKKGGSGICDRSHLEKVGVESYKSARSSDVSRQCIMNSPRSKDETKAVETTNRTPAIHRLGGGAVDYGVCGEGSGREQASWTRVGRIHK